MFDKSRLSSNDAMFEHVEDINRAIANVRLRLQEEITTGEQELDLALFVDADRYLQAHIRRALMFLDGGLHALNGGYGLVAITCARSLYESTACIRDFCKTFCAHVASDNMLAAAVLVRERSLATKFKDYRAAFGGNDMKHQSIMTFIDALEADVPDARSTYEKLSEAVHPNALGTLLYFEVSEDGQVAKYDNHRDTDGIYAIMISAASLFSLIHDSMLSVLSARLKYNADVLQGRIRDYERRKAAKDVN